MDKKLMVSSYALVFITLAYGLYMSRTSISDYQALYLTQMLLDELAWVLYLAGLYIYGIKRKRLALPVICAFPVFLSASLFRNHMTNYLYVNITLFVVVLMLIYLRQQKA